MGTSGGQGKKVAHTSMQGDHQERGGIIDRCHCSFRQAVRVRIPDQHSRSINASAQAVAFPGSFPFSAWKPVHFYREHRKEKEKELFSAQRVLLELNPFEPSDLPCRWSHMALLHRASHDVK